MADGAPLTVLGQAEFDMVIGGRRVRQNMIVAQCRVNGLLGMDFMCAQDMVIDLANEQVRCAGREVPSMLQARTHCKCARVAVAETVTIPAGSRMIVQGKTPMRVPEGDWMVEPLTKPLGGHSLLVAKTLAAGGGSRVPMEVLNPTPQDIVLYRDTNAALLQPVALSPENEPILTTESVPCKNQVHNISEPQLRPELSKLLDGISYPLDENERKAVELMLVRNQEAFQCEGETLGKTDRVLHDIKTTTDTPIKQRVRRPPIHQRVEEERSVAEMLKDGIIEPSESPWSSPVVLVRKKDGSTRFCIDYRKLNDISIKDSYPLPRIDDSLDALAGAKCFTTLDLASGYWQVGMTEEAKQKSAFVTTSGLFQFTRMPFGLCNAPSTFERLMEKVLAGLQWQICLVYLDDVIIYSRNTGEHVERLETILKRICEAGLKLKPSKCHLFCERVLYLGHQVSARGIETDPDKIRAVQEWGTPRHLTDVRSFLGL